MKLNIIFCTDFKQFDYALTNILNISLQTNSELEVMIITDYIHDSYKLKIEKVIEYLNNNNKIINISLHQQVIKDKIFDSKVTHITNATYLRLFIPKIFKNIKDSVIYLDNDTFIDGDIKELSQLLTKGKNYARIVNPNAFWPKELYKLVNISKTKYFNVGVMILNLDLLNNNDITNNSIQFLKENHSIIKYADQDVLNSLIDFDDFSSNYNIGRLDWPKKNFDYEDGLKIYHFISYAKPWNQDSYNISLIDKDNLEGKISLNHYFRSWEIMNNWRSDFNKYKILLGDLYNG